MPILAIYRWYCISLLHVTEIIYLTNEIVVCLQKEYPAWNRTSGHQKNKKILYLLFDFRFNYAVSHGFTFTFKASLSLSLISGSTCKCLQCQAISWKQNPVAKSLALTQKILSSGSTVVTVFTLLLGKSGETKVIQDASKVLSLTIPLWKHNAHLFVVTVFSFSQHCVLMFRELFFFLKMLFLKVLL